VTRDPLRNPRDPLRQSGPEAEQELFRRMTTAADGFPLETVMAAAMNVLINVIRQQQAGRAGAERAFDEAAGRAKTVLLDHHYDGLGRRRNVFPFTQTIAPQPIKLRHTK
jgi:hypothetical protein